MSKASENGNHHAVNVLVNKNAGGLHIAVRHNERVHSRDGGGDIHSKVEALFPRERAGAGQQRRQAHHVLARENGARLVRVRQQLHDGRVERKRPQHADFAVEALHVVVLGNALDGIVVNKRHFIAAKVARETRVNQRAKVRRLIRSRLKAVSTQRINIKSGRTSMTGPG